MPFEKIVGNEEIKKILTEAVRSGTVSHSYMFIGTDGIGKKMIAKEFAKMILCNSSSNNKPCEICKSCIEFYNENNPDFIEINPDGNSIKIEQIREIQNKIIEKPIISNKKVYIIDDSEKMTKEAQNCLLKTLEEPPEFIVIILITSNENLMLNTIKSRCTKINFSKLSDNEIINILKSFNINDINKNILKASEGSVGKALQFEEKTEIYDTINDILKNISNIDIIELINKAEIIYESKNDIMEILNYINVYLYQRIREDCLNNKKYINSMEIVEKTKSKLNSNSNYDMSIDFLLFKLWEELNR